MKNKQITSILQLNNLIKQSELATTSIQKELDCDIFTAQNITDLLKLINYYCNSNAEEFLQTKDFFSLSKDEQASYFTRLVISHTEDCEFNLRDIFPQLSKEIARIIELDMVADFIVAKSIAEILYGIGFKSHFFGVGCASVVAYILGITSIDLNPIEHGLIFERAFPKYKKNNRAFNFYVDEDKVSQLVSQLEKLYGNCRLIEIDNIDKILQINDVQIYISNCLDDFEEQYYNIIDTIEKSTIATFQEDYMRLLHIVSGYSYDKVNEIRQDISKCKTQEIELHKTIFVSNCITLSQDESQKLFNDIEQGVRHAYCKAMFLSIKEIFNDIVLPF